MENNKPLSAEEQKINEMIEDLTTRAQAGDMNAIFALMLLDVAAKQSSWAEAFNSRPRRPTGMELRDIGSLGVIEPLVKVDVNTTEPDFELTGLGKYIGNSEKGVIVRVIPDKPARYIHEAPRGLQ